MRNRMRPESHLSAAEYLKAYFADGFSMDGAVGKRYRSVNLLRYAA